MECKLEHILKGAVVLPYDDVTTEIIDNAVRAYTNEEEDVFSLMDEMLECFLTGNNSSEFAKQVNIALAENNTIKKIPSYVVRRLALYKIYVLIEKNEDKEEKSVLASMLMNYIILRRVDLNSLPLKDVLLSFYAYHIASYIEEMDKVEVCGSPCLIGKVASKNFKINQLTSETDLSALQIMAKEANMFRCERLLAEDSIQSVNDPYVKVFVALRRYFEKLQYPYYNIKLNDILQMIFPNGVKSGSKQLDNIIESILSVCNIANSGVNTKSSVIIRLFQEPTAIGELTILKERFSVKEFAAWLYYELLIECVIDKIS